MTEMTFDIVAIGGGTAGLVSAAGAAGLGARAALIERDRLGGDCLWTGCVPSKALIGSARLAAAMRTAADFGIEPVEPVLDRSRVLESVREVRARIAPHDDPERFRGMGVDVIEGEARFVSAGEVEVDGRRVRGRKFVIATGSRPAVPPIEGLEEAGYYTNETAFDREGIPESVLIMGGGAIGIEFAQAYRRLGVDVTVIEMLETILPREDRELTAELTSILEEQGIRLLTGRRVVRAERGVGATTGVRLTLDGDERETTAVADELLVATGRRPNVEGLGLEAAGVEVGRGGVVVDAKLRTSVRSIFAAGDITGGHLFTHVADQEARTVIRNALFPGASKMRYDVVPWVTYTDPELAHVGLTEAEAVERHGSGVRGYRYDIAGLDRAITDRKARGLVKIVADRKGRIYGGHILAPSAGTMIMEVAMAMRHGIKLSAISGLIHPYPTMGEGVRKAADAFMRARLTDTTQRRLQRYFGVARRLNI